MVRVIKSKNIEGMHKAIRYQELAGLHDDTKPTAFLATGSLFLEVDTGDVYAFDEAGVAWNKIASLGGGGD